MIFFFETPDKNILAVGTSARLTESESGKLIWLFGNEAIKRDDKIDGDYIGPRK